MAYIYLLRLTLRRPRGSRGVYLPSTTPLGSKTTRGFNRARDCTRLTRAYYVARNRASQGQATNCARNAERRLARASCGLFFLLTTNLSDIFGNVLGGGLQTPARAGASLPNARDAFFIALALPPRVVAALHEPQQDSSALRFPVSLKDSHSAWWEVTEEPHHSHRNSAHAILRAYGRSSLPHFS